MADSGLRAMLNHLVESCRDADHGFRHADARVTQECEIVDGQGMHVLPRQMPAALTPFSSHLKLISRNPARHEDPKAP